MQKPFALALVAAFLLAPLALALGSQDGAQADEAAKKEAEIIAVQLPSYPAGACVVSGEEIEDPIDIVHEGRLVRLCCKMCKKMFVKSPAEYLAEIDRRVVAEQKPSYPLETCPVSGEALGGMGEPIDHVVGTRLVRLCCKGCVKGVQKNTAKVMAVVDAALIEAQKETYPLENCLVSGEPLGSMGEPIDYLYGTKLVRFCCKGCVKGFEKNPQELLAKLAK